jgi:hypothetical protein
VPRRIWEVEMEVTVRVRADVKADSPRKAVDVLGSELSARALDVDSKHKGIVFKEVRKPGVGTHVSTEVVWDDEGVVVDPARWE